MVRSTAIIFLKVLTQTQQIRPLKLSQIKILYSYRLF